MVCVDNSEYTRNGDYAPTRFQAQADAVNLLAGAGPAMAEAAGSRQQQVPAPPRGMTKSVPGA